MSINTPTEESGDIQIGPTEHGMVRLYVRSGDLDLPMDFSPEEALEIAAELEAAAAACQPAPKASEKSTSSQTK